MLKVLNSEKSDGWGLYMVRISMFLNCDGIVLVTYA